MICTRLVARSTPFVTTLLERGTSLDRIRGHGVQALSDEGNPGSRLREFHEDLCRRLAAADAG